MANWSQVRLGDVCDVERGGSPRPIEKFITEDENGINWIKIGDTTDSMYITHTIQKIIPEGAKKSRYVQAGDFLLSNSMSFGRPYILMIDGCIHDGWLVLRDKDNLFDKHFLYYYLSAPITYQRFKSMAVGGVVNNLNSEMVRNVEIPLPPLDEQRRIAAVLDKVSDLIAKRREQLDKLDELVKARFVEMFGDPITNTKGWKQEFLREATSKIGSGATPKGGRESYQASGISFIRSMNVHDGHFEYRDLAYITEMQAAQLDNVTVEENDVFINITGASVARSCIVPREVLPARVNQHVAIIRCIGRKLNPLFANSMFLNDRFKRRLLEIGESGGATRQAITKQQLEMLRIILPPQGLQEEFAAFVKQTNKSKLTIQQSLDKLEVLKKALMQQYFG